MITICRLFLIFGDIYLKFSIRPFLPKKLLIYQNRYRTTIGYSCNRNWTIGIKYLYGKLFNLMRYLTEICYRLLSKPAIWNSKKWLRSDHYSIWLSYEMIDQYQVIVWKTFIFDEISSRYLTCILFKGSATISEESLQIGPP